MKLAVFALGIQALAAQNASPIPRLLDQHGASQIIVDGHPFLVRGGELENSSASSLAYLDSVWPIYAPEFLKPDQASTLGNGYDFIEQITPLILANQGTGRMLGIRSPTDFDGSVNLAPQQFTLGNYTFDVHFKEPAPISTGAKIEAEMPGAHGGLIIQTAANEFLVAGTGMIITFGTNGHGKPHAGIDSTWEGHFDNGAWVPGRNLNGDDDYQGRYLRMPSGDFTIRRVRLYTY